VSNAVEFQNDRLGTSCANVAQLAPSLSFQSFLLEIIFITGNLGYVLK